MSKSSRSGGSAGQKRSGAPPKKSEKPQTKEEFYASRKKQLEGRKGIWWVSSFPKSGNTWLRYLLALYYTDNTQSVNDMFLVRDDIRWAMTQAISNKVVSKLTDEEMLLLRPAALHNYIVQHTYPWPIFLKTHNRIDIHPYYLFPAWLTFGAVYIYRDPRDVAVSWANHMDKDIDFTIKLMTNHNSAIENTETDRFRHFLGHWSSHVNGWLNVKDFPFISTSYEELQQNPLETTREILQFLLQDPILEDRLKVAVERAEFSKLKKYEEEHGFKEAGKTKNFFKSGKAGGWREVLTKAQAKRIWNEHGQTMKELGYEQD